MKQILMVDNYDSFTFNLVQILEQVPGVSVTVVRNDQFELSQVRKFEKVVLSPGPGLPSEAGRMPELVKAYSHSKSILGVCLGHQCIAEQFGAKLFNLPVPKHGKTSPIRVVVNDELLYMGLPEVITVGRYHSWAVDESSLPKELEITALSDDGVIMGIRHRHLDIKGVQFHPESILTPCGIQMIKNWIGNEVSDGV